MDVWVDLNRLWSSGSRQVSARRFGSLSLTLSLSLSTWSSFRDVKQEQQERGESVRVRATLNNHKCIKAVGRFVSIHKLAHSSLACQWERERERARTGRNKRDRNKKKVQSFHIHKLTFNCHMRFQWRVLVNYTRTVTWSDLTKINRMFNRLTFLFFFISIAWAIN